METSRATAHLFEGDRFPESLDEACPGLTEQLLRAGVLRPDPAGQARIQFVGVAVKDALTLVLLPKVRVDAAPRLVQRQIIRALKKYARRAPLHHEPAPYLNADPEVGSLSAIALCDWLMQDYWAHGLYRRSVVEHEENGLGRTNWAATIAGRHPIFSRGRPIYPQRITRRAENDATNFATMLHLHLLESFSAEFAAVLDCDPLVLDHEPVERFDLLPSAGECERMLAAEMRTVYSDRSLALLKTLLAAVRALESERRRGLSLFGTNAFHNVWEAACAHATGNDVDAWLGVLPKPIWRSEGNEEQDALTFRPDVVTPLGNALLIADAKYYRPVMPPALSGVPGVNDVAKQVWYRQHLAAPANDRGYSKTANIFLFPGTTASPVRRVGSVQFPAGQESVQAFELHFLQALEAYSSGSEQLRTVVLSELIPAVSYREFKGSAVEQCENTA
ncbi:MULTISPECIES: LlaJI family restriction endonuclease [Brevundimonas]|uniref:LlaJI family restriction endonuclease n=1 Tax=Brevundimonas sp. UBA7507 TaxID=1946137 RepID=UPI00257BB78F|nr:MULTISPECIES: LlaJI family restriction endonuclease [Brevundimonas]